MPVEIVPKDGSQVLLWQVGPNLTGCRKYSSLTSSYLWSLSLSPCTQDSVSLKQLLRIPSHTYLPDGQRKDIHFGMIVYPPCSNIFMPFVTSVSNITEKLNNSGTCLESAFHQMSATPKSYEDFPTCPLVSLYEYRT